MTFDLSGKQALITGANRGIGKAIALGYAKQGADIIIVDLSINEQTKAEIEEAGVRCHCHVYDLTDCKGISTLVQELINAHGRIDILVNNAGIQRRHDSVDFPIEDWDAVNDINAKTVFFLCQAVGRHMIECGGGKIVNLASLLSFQGGFRVPAYAASKGAVMQFTKSLSNEWAQHNININCLAPGYLDTELNTALIADPVRSRQILERIPAGRWGKPEDIAGAAVFLASSASDYINGIVIPIDGGWLGR
ncbi:2-dehydro-3-deoxy-D-gluconate 5-dehydrogenase KduD [Eubacteriales bacterium OttesenSCG-928-N14]|nr:2-dehydro-3-deoxy-D-gluconate 5-dehydrogenase KduD [Eubacteriales bacterium OttesenSCG-928-N14]